MARRLSDLVSSQLELIQAMRDRTHDAPSAWHRAMFRVTHTLDEFGLRDSIFVCIVLPAIYLLVAIIHTAIAGPQDNSEFAIAVFPNIQLSGTRATGVFDSQITGAIASIVSILIAVVVFSVQLHASRTDEGAFAVPYLVRAHRVHPILALGVGVTLANVYATLAPAIVPTLRLASFSWLNLAVVPITLLSGLWLTWITVRDAARSSFDPALPLFRRDMEFALAENSRRERMTAALHSFWSDQGLLWGWPPGATSNTAQQFFLSHGATVVDVNLAALRRLATRLRQASFAYKSYLNLVVGQGDIGVPILQLIPIPVEQQAGVPTAPPKEQPGVPSPPMPVDRAQIQRDLDQAIVTKSGVTHVTSQSLRDFLERYGIHLRELAQEKRAPRLEIALRRLEEITKDWAKAAPDAGLGTRPRLFQPLSDVFSGPLSVDLHDAILASIRTGDEETIDAFLTFLNRLAMLAVRDRHPVLLNEVGGLIQYMYYQATAFETLSEFCARRFDETAYHVLLLFKSLHDHQSNSEQDQNSLYQTERTTLEQALWIVLNLIRTAVDRNRTTDAKQFTERLFDHEKYDRVRHIWGETSPQNDSVDTLFDYLRIVLAGWCVTFVSRHPDAHDAATAALAEIRADWLWMLRLVGVWELYRSEAVLHAPVDSRIGIAQWDPDDRREYRAGVGEARALDGHWIDRGLHALLLKAHDATPEEVTRYFPHPPPRFTWEEKRSREWLTTLSKIDALGIQEDKRDQHIDAALSVIRLRQHAADFAYVERAINEPIDQGLWTEFVNDVEGDWRYRHWFAAIESLCPSPPQATLVQPFQNRAGGWVWRDVFIPGNNWSGGFGEIIGHPLANYEAQSLLWCAQELCPKHGTIDKLADIATHLQNTIKELRSKGYAPNLILLPPADRFACALFKVPLWNVPDADEFGIASLGRWEGLLVLKWPYSNAEFVMVADACRLFGTQDIASKQIDVRLNDLTAEKRSEVSTKIKDKMTKGESPSNDDVRVLAEAWLVPKLGINDREAGVLLSLSKSDGSYAISTIDSLYHRVTCAEIDGDDSVTITLAKRLEGEKKDRTPCPKCRPDKMDIDARIVR